jgi:lipopolysaccharide/colanic/teichoic acid biosynthesis glycosyltransferase
MTDAILQFRRALPQITEQSPRRIPDTSSGLSEFWPDAGLRAFDIIVSLCAIIFLAPLFLTVAVLVFAEDRGPVLYRQERIGRNGRPFSCFKFRSMKRDADVALAELLASDPMARAEWMADQKLRHDPRITRVGAFIREWSLDELAQFFNVLRGEMSVVGPRPIVQAEIPRYGRRFAAYSSVRPGITGLWQVSGRNDVSYRRRVAMDTVYVRSRALWRDMAIVLLTVPAVLARDGSY